MPASLENRNKLKVVTAAMNQNEILAFLVLNNHQHGFVTIMTGKEFCLNGTGLKENCHRIKGGGVIFSSLLSAVFLSYIS